jgi:hypothetical protein
MRAFIGKIQQEEQQPKQKKLKGDWRRYMTSEVTWNQVHRPYFVEVYNNTYRSHCGWPIIGFKFMFPYFKRVCEE